MDCSTWLKDMDEFPSLTSEPGWDDCKVEDDDLHVGLATGDDNEWQMVSPYKTMTTTYADIVKMVARTNGPFQKRQATTFFAKSNIKTRNSTHTCHNNNNNDDDDAAPSELYHLQKSKARRRYLGDTWIYQHRVTRLVRIGYGDSIQGDDVFTYHDPNALVPVSDAPVDRLTFLHHWRYVCKEDPEPEVDRLRKSRVKALTILTSEDT